MPVAAIYKNSPPTTSIGDVWRPWKFLVLRAVAHTRSKKLLANGLLNCGVPLWHLAESLRRLRISLNRYCFALWIAHDFRLTLRACFSSIDTKRLSTLSPLFTKRFLNPTVAWYERGRSLCTRKAASGSEVRFTGQSDTVDTPLWPSTRQAAEGHGWLSRNSASPEAS